jgi:hypothetical protein
MSEPIKDPKGGLTAKGRAYFKRKEGANLKPGVKGAADTPEKMRRKGSFLTRFYSNPSGPLKKDNGEPTAWPWPPEHGVSRRRPIQRVQLGWPQKVGHF